MTKIKALALHLDAKPADITPTKHDPNTFEVNGQQWQVLTDEEATAAAKSYIEDSVWAFNPSFILSHSKTLDGLSAYARPKIEATLKKVAGELCEDANELFKALISDLDKFVADAIAADGRGHFLNTYDGHEYTEGKFFLYRRN